MVGVGVEVGTRDIPMFPTYDQAKEVSNTVNVCHTGCPKFLYEFYH